MKLLSFTVFSTLFAVLFQYSAGVTLAQSSSRVNVIAYRNGQIERRQFSFPNTAIATPRPVSTSDEYSTRFSEHTVDSEADTSDLNLSDGSCGDIAGQCTLRAAIEQVNANGAGIVRFSFSRPTVIELTRGPITIAPTNGEITIEGPGADLLTIMRSTNFATPKFRIFQTSSASHLITLTGMTLENGGGISFLTDLEGGCIYVPLGTVMHLDQMVVQQCSSDFGGGISTRGNLYINRSTIRNNTARLGGGIFVGEEGTLTISNSTINNNGGNQGGGINNNGDYMTLTITNCTISNNFATLDGFPDSPAHGGGIFNYGPLVLTNVTIAGNIGIPYAGGIADWASIYGIGPSQIRNTIIANNSSDTLFDIFTYGLISNGNNLLGAGPINGMEDGIDGDIVGTYELPLNPLLDPLSNNGGPTATHALLAGSRAINKGNKCVFEGTCLSTPLLTDQRGVGFARRIGISVDIGAFESDSSVTMRRTPFDFDGDGKTDPSVYRPSAGEWWWLKSSNGNTGAVQFGISTDNVASADYTGDGKTDVAFWRPSTGQWFVLRSEDFSFFAFPFGATGDVPVPADYDGDGKADAAVFRESSLTWFISKSSGGTDIVGFGAAGDKPVNADYDGDGKADIAVFRPSGTNGAEWWIRRSSNATVFATQFGSPTDKAVPADYTGDGTADIAFWTPSNGNWFILRSEDLSYFAFPFGSSTDIPSPGDYDGDGKTDAAVFRPSNSTWYANRSTAGLLIQQFGSTGDVPIPSAYVR